MVKFTRGRISLGVLGALGVGSFRPTEHPDLAQESLFPNCWISMIYPNRQIEHGLFIEAAQRATSPPGFKALRCFAWVEKQ